MQLVISDNPETPIYRRIAEAVCAAVAAGQVGPGEKLPALTELARSLGVNPLTVSRGYELLQQQGIVRQQRGSGTYVEADAGARLEAAGQRRIAMLHVVLGETSIAACLRETLFIVTHMLDGLRAVLGPRVPSVYVEALTRDCMPMVRDDDAVVITSARAVEPAFAEELRRRGLPVVAIGHDAIAAPVTRVRYDQQQAATLACRHLVERGYKRIGFIGVKAYREIPVAPKYYVYTSLLQEVGLDVRARDVRDVSTNPGRAYAAARAMIAGGDLPEAFFVDTDYKAMEVIGALNDAGVRVPEDVAVVAYDDVPESEKFKPALTTVRTPHREMGRRAAQMLLDWPRDGSRPQDVVLTSQLMVRDSCGGEGAAGKTAREISQ